MTKRRGIIASLTGEEFDKIIKESFSYKEVLNKLGYGKNSGSSYATLKKRIKERDLDVSHFNGSKIYKGGGTTPIPLEDILIENSTYTNMRTLKKRLVQEGKLEYSCTGEGCNIENKWLGKPLTLQLDHINGVNNDHRIENLRFLCPNCHSQTDTFSGRNTRK